MDAGAATDRPLPSARPQVEGARAPNPLARPVSVGDRIYVALPGSGRIGAVQVPAASTAASDADDVPPLKMDTLAAPDRSRYLLAFDGGVLAFGGDDGAAKPYFEADFSGAQGSPSNSAPVMQPGDCQRRAVAGADRGKVARGAARAVIFGDQPASPDALEDTGAVTVVPLDRDPCLRTLETTGHVVDAFLADDASTLLIVTTSDVLVAHARDDDDGAFEPPEPIAGYQLPDRDAGARMEPAFELMGGTVVVLDGDAVLQLDASSTADDTPEPLHSITLDRPYDQIQRCGDQLFLYRRGGDAVLRLALEEGRLRADAPEAVPAPIGAAFCLDPIGDGPAGVVVQHEREGEPDGYSVLTARMRALRLGRRGTRVVAALETAHAVFVASESAEGGRRELLRLTDGDNAERLALGDPPDGLGAVGEDGDLVFVSEAHPVGRIQVVRDAAGLPRRPLTGFNLGGLVDHQHVGEQP